MKKSDGSVKRKGTLYSKLVRLVLVVDTMLIFLLVCGYVVAKGVSTAENPQTYVGSYKYFAIIVIVVFSVILTALDREIMRNIRVGFRDLTTATRDMAKGKLDITLDTTRGDEFGELFREYKILLDATRDQALLANDVANEDLSMEVTPRSDEDVLGKALKKMVAETNTSLSKIRDAVDTVYSKSNEVAEASRDLAQGSTEQASAIEEITASVAEVTQDTKNNAVQANNASELIDSTLKNVIDGNEKMGSMIDAIKEINESSENISKIIKTIDDIAFQTNILALNAAVEAARAGEAGRGFAVVAEEVRNLAAKSAEAASETSELIESSIKTTERGTQIATETGEMFATITQDVKSSADLISKIAEASQNQVTTLEQIDIAVDQVSNVVQTNSTISETCAEASSDLAGKARDMKLLLSNYKLN